MEKRTTSFRLDEETNLSLKFLSGKLNISLNQKKSIGDVIKGLLIFSVSDQDIDGLCQEFGIIDAQTVTIFKNVFNRLFFNAMKLAGSPEDNWASDDIIYGYSRKQELLKQEILKRAGQVDIEDKEEGKIL
jgi:hypothetical protein